MNYQQLDNIWRVYKDNYGLSSWSLALINTKTSSGYCNHRLKVIGINSAHLQKSCDKDIINTLTHEIAHALTRGHNHDYIWTAKHKSLGGTGERTASYKLHKGCYEMVCPNNCFNPIQRHRLTSTVYKCKTCGDKTIIRVATNE